MTKKQPIFYGWWIVVGLFAIDIVASLGRYNLAAFLPFIMADLGVVTGDDKPGPEHRYMAVRRVRSAVRRAG